MLEIYYNTISIYINCFLILVFTALEALLISSILLFKFKKPNKILKTI
jgi:hypothetical protein